MKFDRKIYNDAVFEFINRDVSLKVMSDDCQFTEGPVWHSEGYYLFSDITANTIYRIREEQGKEVFLRESGTPNPHDPLLKPDMVGSNGLAVDQEGGVLICRHGSHDIVRWKEGKLKSFISLFEGRPFNSPNDLILHRDGRLYFSDPPSGLTDGKLNPEIFQPRAGVYCWQDGSLNLICDRYQYPNGVVISPDGKKLYICSNKPTEAFISVYDTNTHQLLHDIEGEASDGIEVDARGNLYLCSKEGLIVLSESGERLLKIDLPAVPANCCWGGKEGKDLLITARQYVLLLRNFLL